MKKYFYLCSLLFLILPEVSKAQEGYIGEIRMFAGSFAPRGWMLCEGQTIQISANQSLFSVLGTTYGGNGRTTFNLPDFRGRLVLGAGQKTKLGQKSGSNAAPAATNAEKKADGQAVAASESKGQPVVSINYIICVSGLYPPRN